MKYKAFISYKHASFSRGHAEALERALKRYAKPILKPPIKIFRDEKHITPGDNLSEMIQNGLDESEFLLFLAESNSAKSEWCQKEIDYWCNVLNRKEQLIIILIRDNISTDTKSNTIDWDKTSALPDILRNHIQQIPLFVDLSWVKKEQDFELSNIKYKQSINAISAKFRNTTPEEINDQEIKIHRKNKNIRNAGISTLVIMLIISIIAFTVAVNQTKMAKDSAAAAELARKQAFDNEQEALRQTEIARDSTKSAQQQREIANRQRQKAFDNEQEAIRQTGIAKDSTKSAQQQREIAELQRQKAFDKEQEARRQEKIAIKNFKLSKSRELASNSFLHLDKNLILENSINPPLAQALALEASLHEPTIEAEVALRYSLLNSQAKVVVGNPLNEQVSSIAFSHDGNYLVSTHSNDIIHVWDLRTKTICSSLIGHSGIVTNAIFSPNDSLISSVSFDQTSKIWDWKNKKIIHTLRHQTSAKNPFFSYDGNFLISSDSRRGRIWDVKTGQLINILPFYSASNKMICTLDDSRIISTNPREIYHSWPGPTSKQRNHWKAPIEPNYDDYPNYEPFSALSPDGQWLLTTSPKHLLLFSIDQIKEKKGYYNLIAKDTFNFPKAYHISWEPKGKSFIASNKKNDHKIFEFPSGKVIHTFNNGNFLSSKNQISKFSPDGNFIAISSGKKIDFYHSDTKEKIFSLPEDSRDSYNSIEFSPDGNTVLLVSGNGLPVNKNHEKEFTNNGIEQWSTISGSHLKSNTDLSKNVVMAQYSPNGKIVATTSWDYLGKIWDAENMKPLFTLSRESHTSASKIKSKYDIYRPSIIFSPNNKYLIIVGADGVHIFFSHNFEHYKSLVQDGIQKIAISHDSKYIITNNGSGGYVDIWDIESGTMICKMISFATTISCSPTDNRLAIANAGEPSTVNIVDLDQLKNICDKGVTTSSSFKNSIQIKAHTHLTTLMKFSPDGSMLVTASEREPPKLWNTSTGKLIKEIPLKSTQSMIKDIDFSPNSKWLGIIHYFRQVSIIPIDLKDLIGLAKNRVQYQLSEEEKKKYGINN